MKRCLFFVGMLCCLLSFSLVSAVECVPAYSCVYAPEICPPAGTQMQTCTDNACGSQAQQATLTCTPGTCAEGCVYQAQCIPFGTRVAGQYCGYDTVLTVQKAPLVACEESWECGSNSCVGGVCQNVSAERAADQAEVRLAVRIVCKLSHLFDQAAYEACLVGTPETAVAGMDGFSLVVSSNSSCHPYQLRGDVDDNGVLNETDLALLRQSFTPDFRADLCCYDVNEDFAIDDYDVGALEQVLTDERAGTVCPVFAGYVSPFAPVAFEVEPLSFIPYTSRLTVPVLEPSVVTSTGVSFIVYNVSSAADELRVYRSFAGSSLISPIATLAWVDEGFVDEGLLSGVTYRYFVEARNSTMSLNSSVISVTLLSRTLSSGASTLSAPTVQTTEQGVALTW